MGGKSFAQVKALKLAELDNGCPDNSKKGGVDAEIVDLLNYINKLRSYVSTSSCSGRTAVFVERAEYRKQTGKWVYVSHSSPDLSEIMEACRTQLEGTEMAMFKYEPFVLHVQCESIEDARKMVVTALESGFKHSGVIPGKKHITVAVRSTIKLDVPVSQDGKLIVDDKYVELLVSLAKQKHEENSVRIERFFTKVKATFTIESEMSMEDGTTEAPATKESSKVQGYTCNFCDTPASSRNALFKHLKSCPKVPEKTST